MPSYQELAELAGLGSKSTAHKLAEGWRKEGFLGQDTTGKLVPGELHWRVPFLGTVQAGIPSADDLRDQTVSLDDWLLDLDHPTYLIEVRGNSMCEAHIMEGDFVVVQRTSNFSSGDIVVAKIDGQWTIKNVMEDSNGRYLQAGSNISSRINPSHELIIVAVVTTVIRKLQKNRPSPDGLNL